MSRSRLNYLERRLRDKLKLNIEPLYIPMRTNIYDYSSDYILDDNGEIQYLKVTKIKDMLKHAAIQSRLNL